MWFLLIALFVSHGNSVLINALTFPVTSTKGFEQTVGGGFTDETQPASAQLVPVPLLNLIIRLLIKHPGGTRFVSRSMKVLPNSSAISSHVVLSIEGSTSVVNQ